MSLHTEWDAGLSVTILLGRHTFHQNCAPNSLPGVKGIRTNVQSVHDRLNFHGGSVCLIPFEMLDLEVCLSEAVLCVGCPSLTFKYTRELTRLNTF